MLPIVIIAVVAIPLVAFAFFAVRRRTNAGEHPVTETDADRRRTEQEFAAAEQYQAEWREEQHKHPPDTTL